MEPITPKQRAYLIDLGVAEADLPASKEDASKLIGKILAGGPSEKQLKVLHDCMPGRPDPESRDEASHLIDLIQFVGACARKKFGSSRCLKNEDAGRIALVLNERFAKAEEKETAARAKVDELEGKREKLDEEISEIEFQLEEDAENQKLAEKLAAKRGRLAKLEEQAQRAEERADKAEPGLADLHDELGNVDYDDENRTIPAADNKLKNRVYQLFRDCEIQSELGRGASRRAEETFVMPSSSKSGCLVMVVVLMVLVVFLCT